MFLNAALLGISGVKAGSEVQHNSFDYVDTVFTFKLPGAASISHMFLPTTCSSLLHSCRCSTDVAQLILISLGKWIWLYDNCSQSTELWMIISCENVTLTGGLWQMIKSRLQRIGEASWACCDAYYWSPDGSCCKKCLFLLMFAPVVTITLSQHK